MGENGDFTNLHNWAYFKNNGENKAKGGMDLDSRLIAPGTEKNGSK